MSEKPATYQTNGHTPAKAAATTEVFNAKEIVGILKDLMVRVTQEECTAQTVQAACSCASQITQLLKVHLDAERLRRRQDTL